MEIVRSQEFRILFLFLSHLVTIDVLFSFVCLFPERELELSNEADYYWSTDGFVRREQFMLQDQFNLANNFHPLRGAGDVEMQMAPGRDAKGYAAYVLGDQANLWLELGRCLLQQSESPMWHFPEFW